MADNETNPLRDAIEDAAQIDSNFVAMPGGVIGHFTEVRTTESGIVASGGWCAPSATVYNMMQGDPAPSLPEEPEPLPVVNEVTMRTEWVVLPVESFYGEEPVFETLAGAQTEYARRVSYATTDEAVSLVRREVIEHVVAAEHGTYVPRPADQIHTGGFPLMPTAPRGGIQYPNTQKREGDHEE